MNILFFATYYYPYLSGITTYPRLLLAHLTKKHHIHILTFRHQSKLSITEKDRGTTIQRMPYCLRVSKGFISLRSIPTFIKHAWKNDLVILNLPNFEGLPLALFAKIFGKKIIAIFHCQVDLGSGLLNRIINSFVNASIYLQLLLSYQIVVYTKDYFNSIPWTNQFSHKVKFILPPVNKLPVNQSYLKTLINKKQNHNWIGFAGRISREKGIEYLIQAISQLDNHQNYHLIFAGPDKNQVVGENDYYRQINKLLTEYQISHHFLGKLHHGKLGAFYKAIDILTLPSINQTEAFGMVQVEAMLLGTPVIASDLPGVRVPIQKTSMGIVVPPKDTEAIVNAIQQIISNNQTYANTKMTGQSSKIFNIDNAFKVYDEIINQITAN